MSDDDNLSELSEAARRAGYIVTEQIDAIIEKAEQQAEAIRREAERDAEDTRRTALESAQRLLARLEALEFPLGSLVASLRDEAEHVSRQLESGSATVDAQGTALTSGSEEAIAVEDGSSEDEHTAERPRVTAEQEEADAHEDFEEAHPEPFYVATPESAERPTQAAGDWKRWIIEDEEVGQEERPAGSAETSPAPAEDEGERATAGQPRSLGRHRSKPRG